MCNTKRKDLRLFLVAEVWNTFSTTGLLETLGLDLLEEFCRAVWIMTCVTQCQQTQENVFEGDNNERGFNNSFLKD